MVEIANLECSRISGQTTLIKAVGAHYSYTHPRTHTPHESSILANPDSYWDDQCCLPEIQAGSAPINRDAHPFELCSNVVLNQITLPILVVSSFTLPITGKHAPTDS